MRQINSSTIEFVNGSIHYGALTLFRHLNLHVEQGTLACITGSSGCGKSSLLHAILGILPLAEGKVYFGKEELTQANLYDLRRRVAWLPQELALPCEWVKEMVQLPFSLRSARRHPFQERAFFALMEKLNLERTLYPKRVNEISGGQRQRLMLASAVLLRRPFLLIDEPTSALDTDSVECVLALLRECTQKGITILTVSHDAVFIKGCDQVIEMERSASASPSLPQSSSMHGNYRH